jgi:hypothetical protein
MSPRRFSDVTAIAAGHRRVTMLAIGPAGTFTGIAIHHQPLGTVLAYSREMRSNLDGPIDPATSTRHPRNHWTAAEPPVR